MNLTCKESKIASDVTAPLPVTRGIERTFSRPFSETFRISKNEDFNCPYLENENEFLKNSFETVFRASKSCDRDQLVSAFQLTFKDDLRVESQASWEKFCNSFSLETNSNESWRKIKNFLKPKGQRDYPTLQHANKVAKTNADKAQLIAESVERHFGIESDHFDSNHFNEVNKFIEDNYQYFYPPEDPDDYRFDVGNEHELVADVDAQTLIKLVKFLKRGKAPGPDTIHNEVLRLGTTTSLFHHLARLFPLPYN